MAQCQDLPLCHVDQEAQTATPDDTKNCLIELGARLKDCSTLHNQLISQAKTCNK